MSKYYLRIEAVNLSNFIEDTQDLSTIRGGSLLLLNAVDEIPNELTSLRLATMTTGASAGLYSFEADDEESAIKVQDEVAGWLRTHDNLKHATFVVDYQLAHEESGFANDLAMLTARNRWRQMQSPTVAIDYVSSSLVCEKDLVRPATETMPGPAGSELSVSSSVATRRLAGQQLKQAFYRRQIGKPIQAQFVRELEELTTEQSKGNLSGKMAVIYLDGNRFGQIKSSVSHSPEAWLNFDTVLKEYRRHMLSGLLDLMSADDNWRADENRYRIETLMWGGDEILWVVPAWKGWETLSYFYETSASWRFGDEPLRHSGGLVFCHHHAPIHRIVTLAKNLAELAKDRSRQENLFAYEVLESFDHIGRDLSAYREERSPQPVDPTQPPDMNSLILRGEDMPGILNFARAIREQIPRKQLHDVVADLLLPTRPPEDPSKSASSIEERHQERKKLISKLKATLKQARVSSETLDQIASMLGGEDSSWLHLNALWDYLTLE
jgi:hypothetical protein